MKKIGWLAACLIAVVVFVGLAPVTAQAQQQTPAWAQRLQTGVDGVRADVRAVKAQADALERRVDCAERGCGGSSMAADEMPAQGRTVDPQREVVQAGIHQFCREVATAGFGRHELSDWLTRLDALRGEGYSVSDSCIRKTQEKLDAYTYPVVLPAAITDPVRSRATIGVMALDGAPVGFPVGLGFGSRSLEGRVLIGVSTDHARPIIGVDGALFPKFLQWKSAQVGGAFRGVIVTDHYDASVVTAITMGPRLRLYDTTPCSSGGYLEISGLFGSVIKDADPGPVKDVASEFTGGGALDLGWAF